MSANSVTLSPQSLMRAMNLALALYADELAAMLRVQSAERPKHKRTVKQLHANLVTLAMKDRTIG